MSDTEAAALITILGMIGVGLISAIAHALVTKWIISSEREKIPLQIEAEEKSQNAQKRREALIIALADLLAESDPQVKSSFEYGLVVRLIHQIEIRLAPNNDEELELIKSIHELGLELQNYIPFHSRPVDERLYQLKKMLAAHARVSRNAQQMFGG